MLVSTILPLLAFLALPIAAAPIDGQYGESGASIQPYGGEGQVSPVALAGAAVNGTCGRGKGRGSRWRHGNKHKQHNSTSSAIPSPAVVAPIVPSEAAPTSEIASSSESTTASLTETAAQTSTEIISEVATTTPGVVLIVTGSTSPTAAPTTQAPAPTTSSTTTAAATTSSPVSAPANNAPAGDASTLLQLHNDFRAKYGAGPLTWNSELAKFASDYGSKCVWKHSGGPYGENLAAGAGGGYSVTSAFNSWADEASKYDWNNPGFASGTGHFTQVVWKATTELGCAAVQCDDGTIFSGMNGMKSTYVICEYKQAGNMVGDNGRYFRENVGTLQG